MPNTRRLLTTSFACLAFLISRAASAQPPVRPAQDDGAFHIIEYKESPVEDTYLVDAGSTPNTCTFEIDFRKQPGKGDAMVSIASAEIIPRTITDCHPFLQSLGRALMFTGSMPSPRHRTKLVVEVAILGTHQTGKLHGGFSPNPPGPWLASKLFLQHPEAEVFLNLNTQDQIGGFSFKDEEYAAPVMTAFVNLLSP
jgi:hypothetical protein